MEDLVKKQQENSDIFQEKSEIENQKSDLNETLFGQLRVGIL